jgi:hypothetical protein
MHKRRSFQTKNKILNNYFTLSWIGKRIHFLSDAKHSTHPESVCYFIFGGFNVVILELNISSYDRNANSCS